MCEPFLEPWEENGRISEEKRDTLHALYGVSCVEAHEQDEKVM